MAKKTAVVMLTEDQQNKIKEATGRTVTQLTIDVDSTGGLSEQELDQVVGGSRITIKFDATTKQPVEW